MGRYIYLPHFSLFLACNGQIYFMYYRPLRFSEYMTFTCTFSSRFLLKSFIISKPLLIKTAQPKFILSKGFIIL